MSMSRIIRVSHACFAGEIASGCIVRVGFAVQAVRPAGRARAGETIQRVVAEGLCLRAGQRIRDGVDVAYGVIRVGVVLQASCRKNFQPSALLVPGIVGVDGVEYVRAAHQLDHAHGGIVGDALGVGARSIDAHGQHVVIVIESHDFVVNGILHRLGQVRQVVGKTGDKLPAAGNLFVFRKDAAAVVVRPRGVIAAGHAHRSAAAFAVRACIIRVGHARRGGAIRVGLARWAVERVVSQIRGASARIGLAGHVAERVVDVTPVAHVGISHRQLAAGPVVGQRHGRAAARRGQQVAKRIVRERHRRACWRCD